MDRTLVLIRHGQSDWNLKNLFTGWKDPDLTEVGIDEAREAGKRLKTIGVGFDKAFTSALSRAQHTTQLVMEELGQSSLPVVKDLRLNERDYGDLSGLNKAEAARKWGEEQVHDLAPLLRHAPARRRKPARHAGARAALLLPGHPALRAARRAHRSSSRTAIRCARC